MDPATWSMISAFVAGGALALSLWNTLTTRGRKEYERLISSNEQHDERLTKVETALSALPEAAQFHDMRVALETVKGQIGVIAERVEPIKAIAQRLQEAMLEKPR